MTKTQPRRRAIGIVRVSQVNGREGSSFHSPDTQRERIAAACKTKGWRLVETYEELDVSGSRPLERRPGLSSALSAVEDGRAEIVVVAYFDRLVRSLRVQAEVVERVERAGGDVETLDFGRLTNGNATQRLTANFLGAVAQYHNEVTAEKSREAVARAVERGVAPWPNVTPGYLRDDDGRFVPDAAKAPVVAEAFELRAEGATVAEVRTSLAARGVELSYHGVSALLGSRVVLGEIHFGQLVNLRAHEPIVDRELFERVQRMVIPRGRRAKSDRLLARLGVLRCASCGGSMVVGTQTQNGRSYPFYRCAHAGKGTDDCQRRAAIGAEIVESIVVEAIKDALKGAKGRASAERGARRAAATLERAQRNLDAAMRALSDWTDQAAVDRLEELRRERDQARERAERLGTKQAGVTIDAVRDWDRLSLEARRALVRATVEQVLVAPGRGAERVTVRLVS